MHLICDLLDKGDKFILPNCCDLIEPDKFGSDEYALLKLPYPITVLEAPWVKDTTAPMPTTLEVSKSERRIALLIESSSPAVRGVQDVFGRLISDREGVLLISIFHANNEWQTHCGGLFMPYGVDLSSIANDPSSIFEKINNHYVESGLTAPDAQRILTEPVILMPELFKMLAQRIGDEAAMKDIIDNSRDEMMMTLQACAVMNCENIISEELPVPPKLQASRRKKGKPPLHEYKILGIGAEFYKLPSGGAAGSKNGPRMHRRRGHVRRLGPDRQTWVRHSIVNAGVKNKIEKTYKVRKPES